MNMKTLVVLPCLLAGLGLGSCQEVTPPPVEPDPALDVPPVVVSRWTELSELFVEFPPLVEDATSRFAIHFTDLKTFEPLREGRATVRLTEVGPGGPSRDAAFTEFTVDGPGRPGIFGIDVTPTRAGRFGLELVLDAAAVQDRHDLGTVVVLTAAEAANQPMTDEDEDGAIPFLKEQQWTFDFATTLVEARSMAASLEVPAEIEPRTGGQADVTTPVAGRLATDVPARPVGSFVNRGETLAEIIPRSGHGEDRPALELAVAEARDALELAAAARARADRLVEAGALPTRRRLETRVAEQTATARVTAAEAHLDQLDATRSGEGDGADDTRFVVRAPMSGVVAQSAATPGASVEEGARLFGLVALDRVHVVGALPEAELSRVGDLAGAEFKMPGGGATVPLEHLVAVGRVLDVDTRTVPIIYELSDPDPRLAIGQAVTLRVFVSATTEAVTVPESALVDDAGQPVVFVQVGGESFERRPVRLGNREAGHVQILGDLVAGERVVTRGAPLIRLAALSPQVPAHGHTH